MIELSWEDVWAKRAARHFLTHPGSAGEIANVVGSVGGIHAQLMPSAELSIGVRMDGVSRTDIHGALWVRRDLIRIAALRGTIHLLPASELGKWLAALQSKPATTSGWTLSGLGVEPAQVEALNLGLFEALAYGPLTQKELEGRLAGRVGAWVAETRFPAFGGSMPAWRLALGDAMGQGLVCYGPGLGSRVTYTLLATWLGSRMKTEPSGPAALAWAARRYLSAYGPANSDDFGAWFGIKAGAARAVFDDLGSEIELVSVEGWKAWQLGGMPTPTQPVETFHLLPRFDTYVVACRPRRQLVPFDLPAILGGRIPRLFERSMHHHDVKTMATVLINGRVAGFWEQKRVGPRIAITVEPFEPLTTHQRDLLEIAARKTGYVLEADVTLSTGQIDIRPHL